MGGGSSSCSGWAHVGTPAEPSRGDAMWSSSRRAFFPHHAACIVFFKELNKMKKILALHLTDLQVAFGGVTKLLRADAVLANTCYPGKNLHAFGLRSSSYTDRGFSCTRYCRHRECEQIISSVSHAYASKTGGGFHWQC